MTPGVKLKYAAGPGQYGLNFPASDYVDEGVRLIRTTDLAGGSLASEVTGIYVPEDAVDDTDRLSPGDLLLSRSGTIGRAYLAPEAADGMAFAGFLVRFRPGPDADGRFLFYCTQSAEFQAVVERDAISSTIQNFNADRYNNLEVPLPELDEQRAIADYLDRETAHIHMLIAEQQRLIELFRERREAAVRHALLSGIDGGSTKASGVELLREIPENWQMVPTRYLCTITTGSEDSGNATEAGDYPFYVRGREVLRMNHYSFDGEAVMTPGDGQGGTGKVFHYFDGKFEAHQRVYVFKDFEGVTGRFFFYFLSTFLRPVALAGSNTVTMESLRRPLLADFKVAVPPLEEQRRIVRYLDDKIAKIDQLMAETERFIGLSRERQVALITAAVTGQIDVREVA